MSLKEICMKKVSILLLIGLFTLDLFAKDIAGLSIPDSIQAGGETIALNGAGIRSKFFLKVYVGSLYVKDKGNNPEVIIKADEPMAIRLDFLMDVDAPKILDAWNEGFENSSGGNLDALKDRIAEFNTCFSQDSVKGTRYDIVYVPNTGLSVMVNGVEKALIPGFDFKRAVFGIWLGDKPADKDLKKGMLKN
jgi:hypothetical protein